MLKKSLWVIIPILIVGVAQAAIEYSLNKKIDRYALQMQSGQNFPSSFLCTNRHFSFIPFAPGMTCDLTMSGPAIAAGYKMGDITATSRQISMTPHILSKTMTVNLTHDIDIKLPLPHSSKTTPLRISLSKFEIKGDPRHTFSMNGTDISGIDDTKSKDAGFIFSVHQFNLSAKQDSKTNVISVSIKIMKPNLNSDLLKLQNTHPVQVRLPSIEADTVVYGVPSISGNGMPKRTNGAAPSFNVKQLTLSYPADKQSKRMWATVNMQGVQDKGAPQVIPGIAPMAVTGYYYSPDFKAITTFMHLQHSLSDDLYMGLNSMLSATSVDVTKKVHSSVKVMGASFNIARGKVKINDRLIWAAPGQH